MPGLLSHNEPTGNVKLEPIAICGMSCHLPGNTTSPSKFWDLLTSKRAANTTKVPKTRFNIDAHFHKNLERPGCFNAPGGYFIDGPAENFDPTFFSMTPVEAMWLDPQQRKTLEACYEAIESAGLTLDSVSGSNTGVWVGSFTADYQQMTFHDHDFRHNYAATGVDVGIISNRIGNVFDLHGPSSTINTACSSSIYCLHQACNSLRARDCDAALVAGVNLILTVDQHMNTAKLGIMSPTSFCHTFDERADGYGRAEGAGALYLKRLDDAVRDGDVIRAVIRSSAVNSNGKVPGYGITYPNVDGQEMVIRKAYKRAGLDPDETAYFECHGTGTPVGDPIEVRAVSRAMNDTRSIYKPLTIGAVKPNIGHSEAASGIFAVIKAALMVEKGFMPGVSGLEKINPNIHEIDWNVRVNRDTVSWPEGFDCRRASLSSFGYGGTNGHVIVENVENLVPGYRHGAAKCAGPFEKVASYDNSSDRPLLVTMSAHDKTTLARNIEANGEVVNNYYLADFAHTLNTKRTAFAQRAFALVSEPTADLDFAPQNFHFGTPSPTNKGESLVFIFTGQGAAWPAMGRTAIQMFPVFREAISNLDRVLRTIPDPPSFYIEDQLCAPAESSKVVGDANVAQPTLVAIEIAMVDLLASWGITPTATIGHSAGEFAAAYAAGLVSAPEAIIAAYYRGWALERFGPTGGSMLALGKGVAELKDYEARLASLELVVACENSPNSVTLSGMSGNVQAAKDMFDADGVFARELRTGMPYHSHHMKAVAQPMIERVEAALRGLDSIDKGWRNDRCLMVSTVYNRPLSDGDITPEYWAANLTGRVLFSTGVSMLFKEVGPDNTKAIIEVGPHSALAGPFKQICRANSAMNNLSTQYLATIVRTRGNSALSLLETAGQLYLNDVNVNLTEVNKIESRRGLRIKPRTLVDLPKYQWNYDKLFWAEPRRSAEYRQLTHARHDLLGRKILGLSDHSVAWRNVLRMRDLPWLADHKLGGSILFPAAGHLAIAIEAARQRCELEGRPIAGMSLQNVELRTALVIPDAETDVEIQLHLNNITSKDDKDLPSWSWSVESYNEGTKSWMVHSVGQICPIPVGTKAPQMTLIDALGLTQRHSGKQWNDAFRRVGYEYGPTFATLDKVRTHGKYLPQAAGIIPIRTDSGVVEDESRHIIHPVTFDSVLQLAIIATHCGRIDTMPWGIIPVGFEEVNYYIPRDEAVGTEGQAISWLPVRGKRDRRFITHAQLATQEGQLLVDIKGIQTISYEAALPPRNDFDLDPMPYSGVAWRPDVSMCAIKDMFSGTTKRSKSTMWELVNLFNHKDPIHSILAIDTLNGLDAEREVNSISGAPQLTVVPGPVGNPLSPSMQGLSGQVVFDLSNFKCSTNDIVVVAGDDAKHIIADAGLMESLKTTLDEKAKCIMMFDHQHILSAVEQMKSIGLNTISIVLNDGALIVVDNHVQDEKPEKPTTEPITLAYSPQHSALPQALLDALTTKGLAVSIKALDQVKAEQDKRVILYNPFGNLLTNAAFESFDILKQLLPSGVPITWLTSGVNEGKSGGGSLVAGFLRVLREEQASCQVSLLDYDKNETHQSVAAAVFAIVTASRPAENEYWLHKSILHTPRVMVNTNLNSRLTARDDEYVRVALPRRHLQGDLDDGDLVFTPSDELQRVPISSGEVELQVDNIELQADDLKTLPLDSPRLVSCTVMATGTEFRYLRAKTVITWTTKPFETLIRVPGASCVECSSREAGAFVSGLPNICRVINALGTSSLAGKSVLVANATPSMVRAFSLVSERLGFTLKTILEVEVEDDEQSVSNDGSSSEGSFEVADSDVQRFMQDAGSSLVIFAQTFSHATRALWRHIPSGARFVLGECPTGDLQISPDARPFNRGATFQVTTIKSTIVSDVQALRNVVLNAMEVVKRNDMYASSISVYTPDTIKDAADKTFEGGARLTYTYGQDMITMKRVPEQLQLSSEDVYLLVGCLGGLGRSLVSWMMDHGAKHFAFISRSGADKPEAARLIDQITAAGAVPQVFRGDAANTVDVIRAVEDIITSGRRIRGVVHAAMVLNDSMLPNMTLEKWNATLGPKVDGALVLHNVLKDQPLDFFVMTSSLSAQAGLPGQSNYAAANSFLDNLAMQRRLAALPASSLVLPMVLGVGVVAESDDLEGQISKRGLYGVNEAEMLRGFEAAMLSSKPSPSETDPSTAAFNAAIVMGLDPSRIGASIASTSNDTQLAWFDDKRFSSIKFLANIATGQAGGAGQGGAAEASFSEQMNAAFTKEGFNAALLLTASHIIKKCATILKQDEEAFDIDAQSIGAYGLDSMIGVELRNWLFKKLGLNIAFQELLAKTTTFRRLSEMVLLSHGIVAGN